VVVVKGAGVAAVMKEVVLAVANKKAVMMSEMQVDTVAVVVAVPRKQQMKLICSSSFGCNEAKQYVEVGSTISDAWSYLTV